MSENNSARKWSRKAKFRIGILALILAAAVPLIISAVVSRTVVRNNAAGPNNTTSSQSAPQLPGNLSNVDYMLPAYNPDGSMGADDSGGNLSVSVTPSQRGKLELVLTDSGQKGAQGQQSIQSTLTSLNITIIKAEARMLFLGVPGTKRKPGASTSATQPGPVDQWETLDVQRPLTIDLMQLNKQKTPKVIGTTDLAGGRYSEVRLYISKVTASFQNQNPVDLSIVGNDNIIRIIKPYSILAGKTSRITLDFDAPSSIIKNGNSYLFKAYVGQIL